MKFCDDLKELFNNFDAAYEYTFKSKQNLSGIEELLYPVKNGQRDFTNEDLKIIEDKTNNFWHFPVWSSFPYLSDNQYPEIVKILKNTKDSNCIAELWNIFKNIIHVSIILRFIDPDNYAIFTRPVEKIIESRRADNDIETYENYLADLKEIIIYCGGIFTRIADIDIALWVLSRLERSETRFKEKKEVKFFKPHLYELKKRILNKESFLYKLRTNNLLQFVWEKYPLDLAKMLLHKDLFMAGLIARNTIKSRLPRLCKYYDFTANPHDAPKNIDELKNRGALTEKQTIEIKKAWRIGRDICMTELANKEDVDIVIMAAENLQNILNIAFINKKTIKKT